MASSTVDSSVPRLANKISLGGHLDEQQQREYEALVSIHAHVLKLQLILFWLPGEGVCVAVGK